MNLGVGIKGQIRIIQKPMEGGTVHLNNIKRAGVCVNIYPHMEPNLRFASVDVSLQFQRPHMALGRYLRLPGYLERDRHVGTLHQGASSRHLMRLINESAGHLPAGTAAEQRGRAGFQKMGIPLF